MSVIAIVATLNAGYEYDQKRAAEYCLELGERFEVESISMGQSHTSIYLKEFPIGFNSVFFSFEENGMPLDIYGDPRFNPYLRPCSEAHT